MLPASPPDHTALAMGDGCPVGREELWTIYFLAKTKLCLIITVKEGRQQLLAKQLTLSALHWKCLYSAADKFTEHGNHVAWCWQSQAGYCALSQVPARVGLGMSPAHSSFTFKDRCIAGVGISKQCHRARRYNTILCHGEEGFLCCQLCFRTALVRETRIL